MSLIKGLQRRPLIAIATVLAFLVPAEELPFGTRRDYRRKHPLRINTTYKTDSRKGIGSEVRFASRPEQADEAVASAADFIRSRSGLKMSDELKKKLAKAESDVLNGKSPYITINELTDDMTTVVVDRLATLTDKEIHDGPKHLLARTAKFDRDPMPSGAL